MYIVYIYICIYVCIYVCMYVCMYVCLLVYPGKLYHFSEMLYSSYHSPILASITRLPVVPVLGICLQGQKHLQRRELRLDSTAQLGSQTSAWRHAGKGGLSCGIICLNHVSIL